MECKGIVIGYWISDKKRQKFDWHKFEELCDKEGFILKKIDVENDIESQGPVDIFFHKLTDVLSHAEEGLDYAIKIVTRLKKFIEKYPDLYVIDPFEKVQQLRNRHHSYEMIKAGLKYDDNIFIPNFVEIKTKNVSEILNIFEKNQITYPCVFKPLIAQGSSDAHKMMLIFNEQGLSDCQIPCVAQNFINHNAILYKLFIVNNHYQVVERPSFKNFYPQDCKSMNTIFFNSHDISKSGSNSKWSIISEEEQELSVKPNVTVFDRIVKKITKLFGLILVGVDVVIENHSGKYAIIDVNVFPGYDGYPEFFEHLVDSIRELLKNKASVKQNKCLLKSRGDGHDSGIENDEKKKQAIL
ncbi:inositol-tetrakisphosphate 1-kinase-like [Trichogramma pretiosum]|uniref:inositol-tetrakisphosphate 1-kinase-like n=1 Tax=Trichogramma pretiosum TaxID=7493 RepID=UPI0006C945D9|nr:inositol-tetrakisphosphate 1-kinase-like [Trichogramma pretiosum]